METTLTAATEAERLIRCFDPDATHAEGAHEHLVLSPRWGRLRRQHPLLATSPRDHGPASAWSTARHNLLTCRDRSVQLGLATYQHRIRIELRVAIDSLLDPAFDLHRHGHTALDRYGDVRSAVTLRRDDFWIRSLPPDPSGNARFEVGNCFLLPITEDAMLAESKTLW
jgi:hypothetical protein